MWTVHEFLHLKTNRFVLDDDPFADPMEADREPHRRHNRVVCVKFLLSQYTEVKCKDNTTPLRLDLLDLSQSSERRSHGSGSSGPSFDVSIPACRLIICGIPELMFSRSNWTYETV
jgi:hypothetical protein